MKRKKTFDCVEMKRRGAALLREKLKGMTEEEELEFWRRRTEELPKEQEEARARLGKTDATESPPAG